MAGTWIKLGSQGRITLPSELRRALQLETGDLLLVRVVDGELRITTPAAAIRRAQAIVRRYVPAERSLVDELIAERREPRSRRNPG